jgi:putative endonuclease
VRCRGGELDLIAKEGDTVVFVEVRLRKDNRFGGALASITPAKKARLIHAAQVWLVGEGRLHAHLPCRFDVVLMSRASPADAQWIKNAFDAD